jgi:hypothetical protein
MDQVTHRTQRATDAMEVSEIQFTRSGNVNAVMDTEGISTLWAHLRAIRARTHG